MATNLDPTPPELAARLSAVVGRHVPIGLAFSADGLVITESDLLTVVQLLEEADRAAQTTPLVSARVSLLRTAWVPVGDTYVQDSQAVEVVPGEGLAEMAFRVLDVHPLDRERSAVVEVRLAPRS